MRSKCVFNKNNKNTNLDSRTQTQKSKKKKKRFINFWQNFSQNQSTTFQFYTIKLDNITGSQQKNKKIKIKIKNKNKKAR